MPHLLIRGVEVDQVRAVSVSMVAELAALCQCPEDHFLLECMQTAAVFRGQTVASYPFVEVAWFERGAEVRDRFAEIVDRHLRSSGLPEMEIAFRVYREDQYYANGERLGPVRQEDDPAALRDELRNLQEANGRLREQLRKSATKTATKTESAMSSRLRDALRE